MNHAQLLESCAAYALGVLEAAERRALEHHLAAGCPECASELTAMREAAGALALTAPPARPTVRLKRRLLSRVSDDAFFFVRAHERDWEAPAPGVRLARLFIDPRSESETVAIELDAGAPVAGSGLNFETSYVIAGSLSAGRAGANGARLLAFGAREAGAHRHVEASVDSASRGRPRPVAPTDAVAGSGRIVALEPAAPAAWRALGAGSLFRALGPIGARLAHVIRVEAGRSFPEHDHAGAEEMVVLAGDCLCQSELLGPGDYHRAPAGSRHAATHTRTGCAALVIA